MSIMKKVLKFENPSSLLANKNGWLLERVKRGLDPDEMRLVNGKKCIAHVIQLPNSRGEY